MSLNRRYLYKYNINAREKGTPKIIQFQLSMFKKILRMVYSNNNITEYIGNH